MIIIRFSFIFLVLLYVSLASGLPNQEYRITKQRSASIAKTSTYVNTSPITALVQVSETSKDNEVPLYHFGIPPYQRGQRVDEIRDQYKPMLTWLGRQVGCRFDFIGAETYDEMIRMVVKGEVQLAGLAPASYIVAKKQNPQIQLLVTELKWDEAKATLVDYYHGYILVLKNQDNIKTLSDLKGKKFAFVHLNSTSGYRYPEALMRKQGINPKSFFSRIYFLGTHPRVTDAIVAGSVDAGATWDFNLHRAVEKHGDVFRIISKMKIPNLTVVAHPSLPRRIRTKVQNALLTVDPSLLKQIPPAGFVIRPDHFYNEVRSLFEEERR